MSLSTWEEEPPDPSWWNDWHRQAIAAGVARDVAEAGRASIRVSYEDQGAEPENRWDSEVAVMSGIDDDGLAMIEFGLRLPKTALRVWRRIAETCGLRGVRMNGRLVPWGAQRPRDEKNALLAEIDEPHRFRLITAALIDA